MKEGTVRRTARRGPFLREARARESIATYKNGYSDITELKKNNRVDLNERPESIFLNECDWFYGNY